MGRDWYYKSSGSHKAAVKRRSSSSTSTSIEKETHQLGCISSVFHFFDFHQFQCVFSGAAHDQHDHQHPPEISPPGLLQPKCTTEPSDNGGSLSDLHTPSQKGVEAPRNSLELQEGPSSSSSSAMKEENDDSTIPFSVLQLVPLQKSSSSPSSSSDREAKENQKSSSPFSDDTNSQGSKTPNLVARLMGLDLLPVHHEILSATSSPLYRRSSTGKSKSHHQQSHKENKAASLNTCSSRYESGTRSLPDTPRISSARRSDVAPRLSLQVLNRENMCTSAAPHEFDHRGVPSREALESSSPVSARRRRRRDMKLMKVYEESKMSPSKYAKEMVKQVKESVSRKFGADITNTTGSPNITGRGDMRSDCDERIHSPTLLKLRKINTGNGVKPPETTSSLQSKHTSCTAINAPPSSRSPRFRVISKQKSGSPKPAENLAHKPQIPEFSHDQSKPVPTYYSETLRASKSKTTQTSSSSSSSPLPKPMTKCKKASCERFTRKPKKAPPSETIENLRAEGLPRNNSKVQQGGAVARPNQEDSPPSCSGVAAPPPLGVRDDNGSVEAEFRYVRAILERSTGIETWSSSSFPCRRPLDRSLFHALERHGNWYSPRSAGPICLKSYRALLFDLADEVLAGLLAKQPAAADLVEAVWGRMNGFPGANCKTLQDIDALVGSDMRSGAGASKEEMELVAAEIEREVVESLVAETAAGMRAVTAAR